MSRSTRLLAISAVALAGCANPFCPPTEEGGFYPEPTVDSLVIDNLERAYVQKDLEAYRECLDPEGFRFYFDPGEEGIEELLKNEWGLDSLVWGLAEELLSAQVLFESTDYIDLTLFNRRRIWADDTLSVWLAEYYLVVEPPPAEGAGVAQGRAVFTLRKGKDGLWRVLKWEDYKGG